MTLWATSAPRPTGLGNTTSYAYDGFGRLSTTSQPAVNSVSPMTSYTYDADGNKLTETDPDENVTTYTYDSFNRVASQSETIRSTSRHLPGHNHRHHQLPVRRRREPDRNVTDPDTNQALTKRPKRASTRACMSHSLNTTP